jgi:hypothetical protein
MCQDPGPLPGGNTMPTGVPNFPGRCGRTSVTGMSTSIYRLTLVQVDVSTGFSESGAPKADGFWAPGVGLSPATTRGPGELRDYAGTYVNVGAYLFLFFRGLATAS